MKKPEQIFFFNTKSPVTNITYDKCGNKSTGEDRIQAYFAVNVNKRLGVGFDLDYAATMPTSQQPISAEHYSVRTSAANTSYMPTTRQTT